MGAVPNNAPRSQKTARASGEHPGVLKELEVQLEAGTVGYVAASAPLLVVASLAGGDDVDATTVQFLLRKTLVLKKKEEEKEKEEEGGGEGGGGEGTVSGAVVAGAPLAVGDASRWPLAPANEEDDGTPQAPRRSLFLFVREEEEEEEEEEDFLVHIFFGFLVFALFVLGNLHLFLFLVSGSRFVAGGVQESWVISGTHLRGCAPRSWQSLVCMSCLLLGSTVDICLRQFTEALGLLHAGRT